MVESTCRSKVSQLMASMGERERGRERERERERLGIQNTPFKNTSCITYFLQLGSTS
jgi:hypothetical protein